ncbi:MAG: hypothetical protein NT130_03800 [Candidatus Micrarchaeota archaeon]|nr:hypothetical protein [Candidatus Micrarchaeota archaeon]
MELRCGITKKGFFFTLLVFIFFFLVLISVTTWNRVQEQEDQNIVIDVRVSKMNEFSNMVREDAIRMTHIIGLNALKSAANYVANNNKAWPYLNNSNCLLGSCIYELMYNASIEGNGTFIDRKGIVKNFSNSSYMGALIFRNWDQQMIQLANSSNFNANLSRDNIGIFQSDPWSVQIGYNLYLNVSDKASDTVSRSEIMPVLVAIPLTNYTVGD